MHKLQFCLAGFSLPSYSNYLLPYALYFFICLSIYYSFGPPTQLLTLLIYHCIMRSRQDLQGYTKVDKIKSDSKIKLLNASARFVYSQHMISNLSMISSCNIQCLSGCCRNEVNIPINHHLINEAYCHVVITVQSIVLIYLMVHTKEQDNHCNNSTQDGVPCLFSQSIYEFSPS